MNNIIRAKLIAFCETYSNKIEAIFDFSEVEHGRTIVAVSNTGVGIAKRSPNDEDIFEVGEALAIARMMKDDETVAKIIAMIDDMYNSKLKNYKVEIIEKSYRLVEVSATSKKQAIEFVREQYENGEIVLDYNDFDDVKFKAEKY